VLKLSATFSMMTEAVAKGLELADPHAGRGDCRTAEADLNSNPTTSRRPSAKKSGPEGARVTEQRRYYDIPFLMKEFGLTEDQVRYRLDRILPLLEKLGHTVRRGANNKILICDEGFSLFKRAMEMERSGESWHSVLKTIQLESQPYSLGELRRHYEKQIEVLERQIEILHQQLEFLRRQNEDLREMLRRLMDKATSGASGAEPTKEKPPTA